MHHIIDTRDASQTFRFPQVLPAGPRFAVCQTVANGRGGLSTEVVGRYETRRQAQAKIRADDAR